MMRNQRNKWIRLDRTLDGVLIFEKWKDHRMNLDRSYDCLPMTRIEMIKQLSLNRI